MTNTIGQLKEGTGAFAANAQLFLPHINDAFTTYWQGIIFKIQQQTILPI